MPLLLTQTAAFLSPKFDSCQIQGFIYNRLILSERALSCMARLKTAKVTAVNIKIQPDHNPEMYIRLLELLLKEKVIAPIQGHDRLMIAFSYPQEANKAILQGFIITFTDLDKDTTWINISDMIKVSADQIPEIPDNLKPNARIHAFIFDSVSHLMLLLLDKRSVNSICKGLQNLCSDQRIIEEFGSVDIETVKDIQYINDIIEMSNEQLNSLKITISLPNPEDLSETKMRIVERYKQAKIKKVEHNEKALPGGMALSDESRALLYISADNGSAVATGRRCGKNEKISTVAHPMQISFPYDSSKNSVYQEFGKNADAIFRDIQTQRKNDV